MTSIGRTLVKPSHRFCRNFPGLAIPDAFLEWPEVFVMVNLPTSATMQKFTEVFNCFSLLYTIVSGNGIQFTST